MPRKKKQPKGWNSAPYNAAFCVAKYDRGMWWILIQESKRTPWSSRKNRRLPGGKPEKGDQGKPRRTGKRELKQETGIFVRKNAVVLELSSYRLDDNHIQHFFGVLYEDCGGSLRSQVKFEQSSGTMLYLPRWIPLREAVCEGSLDGNHRLAVVEFETLLLSRKIQSRRTNKPRQRIA